jgi:hypothetical protein
MDALQNYVKYVLENNECPAELFSGTDEFESWAILDDPTAAQPVASRYREECGLLGCYTMWLL